MPVSRSWLRLVSLLAVALVAGCDLPKDPERTSERAVGGTIRVGVIASPPWASLAEGRPQGIECDLVQAFAASLDAKVSWVPGGESRLMQALAEYRLDIVIGGVEDASAWRDRVGMTLPYYRSEAARDPTGAGPQHRAVRHVVAAPPGENGWLLRLDRFLQARRTEIAERLRQQDKS